MKEVVLFWNDEMELADHESLRESSAKEVAATLGVDECGDIGCDDEVRKPAEEKDDDDDDETGIDVCPICLNSFTIPCRSNCGHLFCGGCILQFWMYRKSIEACKCPLCCCRIVKLQPQSYESDDIDVDDDDVLIKLQNYNALYISRVFGIVEALPVVMGRMLRVAVDPDCLRCIYYVLRLLGLFLGLLYEGADFEFVPAAGGLGIQRMLELIASLLVAALFLIGVLYRWLLKPPSQLQLQLQLPPIP